MAWSRLSRAALLLLVTCAVVISAQQLAADDGSDYPWDNNPYTDVDNTVPVVAVEEDVETLQHVSASSGGTSDDQQASSQWPYGAKDFPIFKHPHTDDGPHVDPSEWHDDDPLVTHEHELHDQLEAWMQWQPGPRYLENEFALKNKELAEALRDTAADREKEQREREVDDLSRAHDIADDVRRIIAASHTIEQYEPPSLDSHAQQHWKPAATTMDGFFTKLDFSAPPDEGVMRIDFETGEGQVMYGQREHRHHDDNGLVEIDTEEARAFFEFPGMGSAFDADLQEAPEGGEKKFTVEPVEGTNKLTLKKIADGATMEVDLDKGKAAFKTNVDGVNIGFGKSKDNGISMSVMKVDKDEDGKTIKRTGAEVAVDLKKGKVDFTLAGGGKEFGMKIDKEKGEVGIKGEVGGYGLKAEVNVKDVKYHVDVKVPGGVEAKVHIDKSKGEYMVGGKVAGQELSFALTKDSVAVAGRIAGVGAKFYADKTGKVQIEASQMVGVDKAMLMGLPADVKATYGAKVGWDPKTGEANVGGFAGADARLKISDKFSVGGGAKVDIGVKVGKDHVTVGTAGSADVGLNIAGVDLAKVAFKSDVSQTVSLRNGELAVSTKGNIEMSSKFLGKEIQKISVVSEGSVVTKMDLKRGVIKSVAEGKVEVSNKILGKEIVSASVKGKASFSADVNGKLTIDANVGAKVTLMSNVKIDANMEIKTDEKGKIKVNAAVGIDSPIIGIHAKLQDGKFEVGVKNDHLGSLVFKDGHIMLSSAKCGGRPECTKSFNTGVQHLMKVPIVGSLAKRVLGNPKVQKFLIGAGVRTAVAIGKTVKFVTNTKAFKVAKKVVGETAKVVGAGLKVVGKAIGKVGKWAGKTIGKAVGKIVQSEPFKKSAKFLGDVAKGAGKVVGKLFSWGKKKATFAWNKAVNSPAMKATRVVATKAWAGVKKGFSALRSAGMGVRDATARIVNTRAFQVAKGSLGKLAKFGNKAGRRVATAFKGMAKKAMTVAKNLPAVKVAKETLKKSAQAVSKTASTVKNIASKGIKKLFGWGKKAKKEEDKKPEEAKKAVANIVGKSFSFLKRIKNTGKKVVGIVDKFAKKLPAPRPWYAKGFIDTIKKHVRRDVRRLNKRLDEDNKGRVGGRSKGRRRSWGTKLFKKMRRSIAKRIQKSPPMRFRSLRSALKTLRNRAVRHVRPSARTKAMVARMARKMFPRKLKKRTLRTHAKRVVRAVKTMASKFRGFLLRKAPQKGSAPRRGTSAAPRRGRSAAPRAAPKAAPRAAPKAAPRRHR